MRRAVSACLLLAIGASARAGEPLPEAPPAVLGVCCARMGDVDPVRSHRIAGLEPAMVATEPIEWGAIEPKPPAPRPGYAWEALDALVRDWQGAGFDVMPVLTTGSPWACVEPNQTDWRITVRRELPEAEAGLLLREAPGATPPKAALWTQWERYVEDLVERYDGDGILDMPGLRRPVRWLQILDHAQEPRRWMGSAAEYLRLVHHAEEAARRAEPATRLVHYAVDLHGTGADPAPDADETKRRRDRLLAKLPEPLALEQRRAFEFQDLTLGMTQPFRVVPHVGSTNLLDETADLRALRRILDADAATSVEVWLVDAPLRKLEPPETKPEREPSAEEQEIRRVGLLAARRPDHPEHDAGVAWLRRGAAYDLVRTATRALAAGARRILVRGMGSELGGEDLAVRDAAGAWAVAPARVDAAQWNALATRTTLVREIPASSNVRAYSFEAGKDVLAIVLLRDPTLSWAGPLRGEPPEETVTLRLPPGDWRLEPLASSGRPPTGLRNAADGIALRVGPAPVYLVPNRP